jgi:hypothetical protein
MKRQYVTYPVSIGPGLYVRAGRPMTTFEREMEAIRRQQRTCEHKQRDPNGTCYHCGHRMPRARAEAFGD